MDFVKSCRSPCPYKQATTDPSQPALESPLQLFQFLPHGPLLRWIGTLLEACLQGFTRRLIFLTESFPVCFRSSSHELRHVEVSCSIPLRAILLPCGKPRQSRSRFVDRNVGGRRRSLAALFRQFPIRRRRAPRSRCTRSGRSFTLRSMGTNQASPRRTAAPSGRNPIFWYIP